MKMEAFSEIVAIFRRWNTKLLRQPIFLFFSLIQPLVWFLLFTQAFSSIGNIPIPGTIPTPGAPSALEFYTGAKSYITFFTAAVIIQTRHVARVGRMRHAGPFPTQEDFGAVDRAG